MIGNNYTEAMQMSPEWADLWSPVDQSLFGGAGTDCPTTQSYITPQSPQLVTAEDEWLQDFEVFRGLCDGIGLDLNNEPELTLVAMTKEVQPNQYHRKVGDAFVDYLDSTAFLSPQSMDALSPQATDINHLNTELDLAAQDLNTTSAMTILEEILSSSSSANSTDTEDCLDAELDLQSMTEVSPNWASVETTVAEALAVEQRPRRRQTKRKALEVEDTPAVKPKARSNKRSKASIVEKKERKRDQNKSAANRYRLKKRAELESIDDLEARFAKENDVLKSQLQKLQMEFKVVLPLAKAAFMTDANKSVLLQMLDIRVLNHNLLDLY